MMILHKRNNFFVKAFVFERIEFGNLSSTPRQFLTKHIHGLFSCKRRFKRENFISLIFARGISTAGLTEFRYTWWVFKLDFPENEGTNGTILLLLFDNFFRFFFSRRITSCSFVSPIMGHSVKTVLCSYLRYWRGSKLILPFLANIARQYHQRHQDVIRLRCLCDESCSPWMDFLFSVQVSNFVYVTYIISRLLVIHKCPSVCDLLCTLRVKPKPLFACLSSGTGQV